LALGKVKSIALDDNTIGIVLEDETGLSYGYNDPNLGYRPCDWQPM
jgi:hypothetical protein